MEFIDQMYLFSSIFTGNITLITIVISINQLLLGRELKAPGETADQIDNIVEHRQDIENSADQLAPIDPSKFLHLLFENTRREAERLGDFTTGEMSDSVTDEIDRLSMIPPSISTVSTAPSSTKMTVSFVFSLSYCGRTTPKRSTISDRYSRPPRDNPRRYPNRSTNSSNP